MNSDLGYQKRLFILAFDHRSTFAKKMFGTSSIYQLSSQQSEQISSYKNIIYEGFKEAVLETLPKDEAAVLVDENFADQVLRDAKSKGFITVLTTEKSGQGEFDFEYGDNFGEHINKYKPSFAKALIRYNSHEEQELKIRREKKLKLLSDFCHSNGYKFLLEVLVRPELSVQMIKELQKAQIEPDVWKLEGMDNSVNYREVVQQAKSDGRDNVSIVILGRGEGEEKVGEWIKIGSKVEGVIGFAVGRTIFWDSIVQYKENKIDKEEAIVTISNNFQHFYKIFTNQP